MQLLQETITDIVTESVLDESTNTKKTYIEGITLVAETVNGNKRCYPKSVLAEAIKKHIENDLKLNRCVGCLNHPTERASEIDPEQISHIFESVKEEGNNFITRAKVIDSPKGKILENLLNNGIKMGISSRGLGNVVESNGVKIVKEFQIVSLGDAVFLPSAPGAFLSAIQENYEWIYDNGVLVKKDLSEEIDKYKKIIQEAKAKDIQNVVKKIFSDYINKLK